MSVNYNSAAVHDPAEQGDLILNGVTQLKG